MLALLLLLSKGDVCGWTLRVAAVKQKTKHVYFLESTVNPITADAVRGTAFVAVAARTWRLTVYPLRERSPRRGAHSGGGSPVEGVKHFKTGF